MTQEKILTAASILSVIVLSSCIKDPSTHNGYLRFSNGFVHIANQHGSSNTISVESNIDWQLWFADSLPGWTSINKMSGHGNAVLTVTALTDNPTHDYRFAKVVGSPVTEYQVPQVQMTIVQYDSVVSTRH